MLDSFRAGALSMNYSFGVFDAGMRRVKTSPLHALRTDVQLIDLGPTVGKVKVLGKRRLDKLLFVRRQQLPGSSKADALPRWLPLCLCTSEEQAEDHNPER